MVLTIQLDTQSFGRAIKIQDVIAGAVLAPEFSAVEL
jgi:hypothetical protein